MNSQKNSPAVSPGATSRWEMTFGDLLTLLLCFFVWLIPFSVQHATEKRHSNQDISEENIVPRNSEGEIAAHGTPFAPSAMRDNQVEVRFAAQDFAENDFSLAPEMKGHLKKQLLSGDYELNSVLVESCAGAENSEPWFDSMQRGLMVRGQLIDAGFRPGALRLRLLGPHCSALRRAGEQETVVLVRVRKSV